MRFQADPRLPVSIWSRIWARFSDLSKRFSGLLRILLRSSVSHENLVNYKVKTLSAPFDPLDFSSDFRFELDHFLLPFPWNVAGSLLVPFWDPFGGTTDPNPAEMAAPCAPNPPRWVAKSATEAPLTSLGPVTVAPPGPLETPSSCPLPFDPHFGHFSVRFSTVFRQLLVLFFLASSSFVKLILSTPFFCFPCLYFQFGQFFNRI